MLVKVLLGQVLLSMIVVVCFHYYLAQVCCVFAMCCQVLQFVDWFASGDCCLWFGILIFLSAMLVSFLLYLFSVG